MAIRKGESYRSFPHEQSSASKAFEDELDFQLALLDRIEQLEALVRDIWDGSPKCTTRTCGDCEHEEDYGCGIYRRMCELGLMGSDAE